MPSLEEFLLEKLGRKSAKQIISKLKADEVDHKTILSMTDTDLQYYIPNYCDRIAVRNFCRNVEEPKARQTCFCLKPPWSRIRRKSRRNKAQARNENNDNNNNNENKESVSLTTPLIDEDYVTFQRRVELIWGRSGPKQNRKAGTTERIQQLTVDKDTTMAQILEIGKSLFFPAGKSTKSVALDFDFSICDFQQQPIELGSSVEIHDGKRTSGVLKLYVFTKPVKEIPKQVPKPIKEILKQVPKIEKKYTETDQIEKMNTENDTPTKNAAEKNSGERPELVQTTTAGGNISTQNLATHIAQDVPPLFLRNTNRSSIKAAHNMMRFYGFNHRQIQTYKSWMIPLMLCSPFGSPRIRIWKLRMTTSLCRLMRDMPRSMPQICGMPLAVPIPTGFPITGRL